LRFKKSGQSKERGGLENVLVFIRRKPAVSLGRQRKKSEGIGRQKKGWYKKETVE